MTHYDPDDQEYFERFLSEHRDDIRWQDGAVRQRTVDYLPITTDRIVRSLATIFPGSDFAHWDSDHHMPDKLSEWILSSPDDVLKLAELSLKRPPADVHMVPGRFPIFYDFENLDIALTELFLAGAGIAGNFLDFGCSSGRNLAVLQRAFGENLRLYGADPSAASIEWVRRILPDVCAVQNDQSPPMALPSNHFDIVIAKSIWTHFSTAAATAWFKEIARCLKPGGYFFFSTHGRHDIASRIAYDVPRPRYHAFAGHDAWTKSEFLRAAIEGLASDGMFFQPFKQVDHQRDLRGARNAVTEDWGVTFFLRSYVEKILPEDLTIVSYSVARTGNRHDAYVVRKRCQAS